MKRTRGLGFVYQPKYLDKQTGQRKTAAIWWIQYSVRGKRYRESSRSASRTDAVKLLKRRIGDAAEGRALGHDVEKTTFEHLSTILLDDYKANGRRSTRRAKSATQNLRRFFADSRAIDITEDRLNAYIVFRQQEHAANATINRELAALKRASAWLEKKSDNRLDSQCCAKTTPAKDSSSPNSSKRSSNIFPTTSNPSSRSHTSPDGECRLNCSRESGSTSISRTAG